MYSKNRVTKSCLFLSTWLCLAAVSGCDLGFDEFKVIPEIVNTGADARAGEDSSTNDSGDGGDSGDVQGGLDGDDVTGDGSAIDSALDATVQARNDANPGDAGDAGGNPVLYRLSVEIAGKGAGSVTSAPSGIDCGATCAFDFKSDETVTLTATPDGASKFATWSGACSGTDTCQLTMSAARSVTATFSLKRYSVNVSSTGTGTGTVTLSPGGIDCGSDCTRTYEYGQVVTLSQGADTSSKFIGWSGGCTGTGTCQVTVTDAVSVTARFDLLVYSHTIAIDGVNDFKAAYEAFVATSTGYTGYISWDNTYLYLGMDGINSNDCDPDHFLTIYIGGSPGTSVGLLYTDQQPSLPFSSRYHFRWNGIGSYTNMQIYAGDSWTDGAWDFTGDVCSDYCNYVELRISLADIGNPGKVKVHMCMVGERPGYTHWTYAGVPETSFTDGFDPDYSAYLEFDLTSGAAPNSYVPLP
jgi:hypothetical protein